MQDDADLQTDCAEAIDSVSNDGSDIDAKDVKVRRWS